MTGVDVVLAERLPVLYRNALDAVDLLARQGARSDATRLRAMAVRAYSRAWDERCRRALESITTEARLTAGLPSTSDTDDAREMSAPTPIGAPTPPDG